MLPGLAWHVAVLTHFLVCVVGLQVWGAWNREDILGAVPEEISGSTECS